MARRRAADLVLNHANVVTLDPRAPRVEAVAVSGGTILAVGTAGDMSPLIGSTTRVIDCRGKTVIPGFNDAHCHFFAQMRRLLSVDCSPSVVSTIAEIQTAIRKAAEKLTPGTWVTATGYDESRLDEKRHPTHNDLNKASTLHPIRLLHRTGRASVLNSLALSLANIRAQTEDPSGALIDRDDAGEPTGLLFQMDHAIEAILPPPSEQEFLRGVHLADRLNISLGITSFQDASVTNDLRQWQQFERLKANGMIHSRVTMMPGITSLPLFVATGHLFRSGDNHLRTGAVKIVIDRTTGVQNPPQGELDRHLAISRRAGFQVAVHCVEEEDIAAAVTALASSSPGHSHHARPRIEHCSVCPPNLVEQLRQQDAVVVSQPPFLYFNGARYLTEVPPLQRQWLYRFRSFHQNGIPVAASSDSPVAGNDPLLGIYAATTRRTSEGETILPEERVSPLQALRMYTSTAAYAAFDEKEKGTISPRKLADLVVLSADPTRTAPEALRDIRVEKVIVGGQVVMEV